MVITPDTLARLLGMLRRLEKMDGSAVSQLLRMVPGAIGSDPHRARSLRSAQPRPIASEIGQALLDLSDAERVEVVGLCFVGARGGAVTLEAMKTATVSSWPRAVQQAQAVLQLFEPARALELGLRSVGLFADVERLIAAPPSPAPRAA